MAFPSFTERFGGVFSQRFLGLQETVSQPALRPNGNRAQRRSPLARDISILDRSVADLMTGIGRTHTAAADTFRRDRETVDIIYRGEPTTVVDYIAVRRRIPKVMSEAGRVLNAPEAHSTNYWRDAREALQDSDVFSYEIAGTSLLDIEQMSLPLSTTDIQRINKVFRQQPPFPVLDKKAAWIRQLMGIFATQQLARPREHVTIPAELRPLHARLVDYFDYFVDSLIDPSATDEEKENFLLACYWANGALRALSFYVPARLGITPSSAVKLYREWVGTLSPSWKFAAKPALRLFEKLSQRAFYDQNLLPGLEEYQRYSSENDKRATQLLTAYYEAQHPTDEEIILAQKESEEFQGRLTRYHRSLHRDIIQNGSKAIEFQFSAGHPVEKIIVTAQEFATHALIFILQFTDRKTHLTLEINEHGVIYGFPHEAKRERPHLIDELLGDVLKPLLETAKQRYPHIEPAPKPALPISQVLFSSQDTPRINGYLGQELAIDEPRPLKRRQRLAVMLAASTGLSSEPVPSTRKPKESTRKARVVYSRKTLPAAFTKQPRPNDLEMVRRALHRFEQTGDAKFIDWTGGKRLVLRVGDMRIILRHEGDSIYAVETIGERQHVYRGRYADRI